MFEFKRRLDFKATGSYSVKAKFYRESFLCLLCSPPHPFGAAQDLLGPENGLTVPDCFPNWGEERWKTRLWTHLQAREDPRLASAFSPILPQPPHPRVLVGRLLGVNPILWLLDAWAWSEHPLAAPSLLSWDNRSLPGSPSTIIEDVVTDGNWKSDGCHPELSNLERWLAVGITMLQ